MHNEDCDYVLELRNTLHISDTEKELTKSVKRIYILVKSSC